MLDNCCLDIASVRECTVLQDKFLKDPWSLLEGDHFWSLNILKLLKRLFQTVGKSASKSI